MNIRKFESKDFEATKYVCLNDMLGKPAYEKVIEYVEVMFCRYYLEKEPENCFVAVDENDKVIGYTYGAADYDTYQNNFSEYIRAVAEIENRKFLNDALTEMYDHAIYKEEYPAHLHIDILPDYQSKGIGSKLLSAAEKEAKSRGCHHVHLDTMSWQAPEFYKKHGYTVIGILPDIPSGNQKYLLMKEL